MENLSRTDLVGGFSSHDSRLRTHLIVLISVTENGFCAKSDLTLPIPDVTHDDDRVEYYRSYTDALLRAIHEDEVPIHSYFAWSTY